jgi:hypothetical protein
MCVRGFDFASVCDFMIGFWNCFDSMVFFLYILFVLISCQTYNML